MNLPRVGVVFAPRGAATLRDVALAARDAVHPVIVLPDRVVAAAPEITQVARRLFPEVVAGVDRLPPLDGVVTFHDDELETADRLARRLGLGPRDLAARADKLRQRRVLRHAGLSRIDVRRVDTPADIAAAGRELGFPLVLKPRRGVGGRGVRIVASAAEAIRPLHSYLAEQYIPDRDPDPGSWMADFVSVETCSLGDRHDVLAVFGKLPVARVHADAGMRVRTTGDLLPYAAPPDLPDLVTSALEAMGIRWAVTHTEVKLGRDGPEIIEINCRLGGHLARLVRRHAHRDLVRAGLVTAARREPPPAPDGPPGQAVAGVFLPFPDARGEVASAVSARQLLGISGVCAVDEVATVGRPRDETDGIAANVVLQAPDAPALRDVLAGYLDAAAVLFAADHVGESDWFRRLTTELRGAPR